MFQDHVILCGLGRVGWHVLDLLKAAGTHVVVIDSRCEPTDARLGDTPLIRGDCQKQPILEQAGIANARGVLVLPSDELVCITTALMARRLNPVARIVVRMFNQNLVSRLGAAVSNVVALSTSALAAPLLALIARTGAALGTFRLDDGKQRQVAEVIVSETSALRGTRVGLLPESHKVFVLDHASGSESRHLHEIDQVAQIQFGDRLVICGETEVLKPLLSHDDDRLLPDLLWAGVVRRFSRVGWRTLGEVDLAVKICTAVLLAVIIASTLVFHYGLANESIPDALYRTISLMATGADMGGRELPEGSWQKVFVSLLRLAGTALTAAFTAILTNYLVRAQLGGALEIRHIPDSGHIVVCGLGRHGFRIVNELLEQDEQVVAIERQRDNPFVATIRRQKVPVIVGDATVAEVLKQARAGTARAIIACTNNELVNIEIGLLARELNPKQRVVLLLVDPRLAQTVREEANIRLAVSTPALAGPAFIAALHGDRVRSVFLVSGKLLAVVDIVVAQGETFLVGQNVRSLAAEYQFLAIRLVGADRQARVPMLDAVLTAGDELTIIVELNGLQRLQKRGLPGR